MAWIETPWLYPEVLLGDGVATREGGVDRNLYRFLVDMVDIVATREGGVDRNVVDGRQVRHGLRRSPPARVAWIETLREDFPNSCRSVATREGGVDRNVDVFDVLEARGVVATREGGVDRNVCSFLQIVL